MHCRCWRNTKSKAAFTRHYARYVKEKCCRLIKSISSSAARRQRRLRLLSTMRLTKPTNPPPGIWPTFGLKSNASGAQPFPSAGNGAEKSQRAFINHEIDKTDKPSARYLANLWAEIKCQRSATVPVRWQRRGKIPKGFHQSARR